jgi:hypothetical protein
MNFGFGIGDVHGNKLKQAEVPIVCLGYGSFSLSL